jgi:hypothetical protein
MSAPAHQPPVDPLLPEPSAAPFILPQAFNPMELLGSDPAAWIAMLRGLAPKMPVQLHCEPYNIKDIDQPGCQPIFRNAVTILNTIPDLGELMHPTNLNGEPRRARIKLRLATSGKFIHRNRYIRRQILCCLSGEQTWLFMSAYGGGADAYLSRSTNDNWNGFRSTAYPTMLSVEKMHELAANAPEGVVARVVKFRAGDVMMFDGRWWHATSYTSPVLNVFFTPGDDMEVAVKEHKRRMAMPMQKDLALCKISMAKVSKLSYGGAGAWTKSSEGKDIDWTKTDGHIALPETKSNGHAPAQGCASCSSNGCSHTSEKTAAAH